LAGRRGRLGDGGFIRHHYDIRSQSLGGWKKISRVGPGQGEGGIRSTGNHGIAIGAGAEIKGKLAADGFSLPAGDNSRTAAIEACEASDGGGG